MPDRAAGHTGSRTRSWYQSTWPAYATRGGLQACPRRGRRPSASDPGGTPAADRPGDAPAVVVEGQAATRARAEARASMVLPTVCQRTMSLRAAATSSTSVRRMESSAASRHLALARLDLIERVQHHRCIAEASQAAGDVAVVIVLQPVAVLAELTPNQPKDPSHLLHALARLVHGIVESAGLAGGVPAEAPGQRPPLEVPGQGIQPLDGVVELLDCHPAHGHRNRLGWLEAQTAARHPANRWEVRAGLRRGPVCARRSGTRRGGSRGNGRRRPRPRAGTPGRTACARPGCAGRRCPPRPS